jgi:hypothetical protein
VRCCRLPPRVGAPVHVHRLYHVRHGRVSGSPWLQLALFFVFFVCNCSFAKMCTCTAFTAFNMRVDTAHGLFLCPYCLFATFLVCLCRRLLRASVDQVSIHCDQCTASNISKQRPASSASCVASCLRHVDSDGAITTHNNTNTNVDISLTSPCIFHSTCLHHSNDRRHFDSDGVVRACGRKVCGHHAHKQLVTSSNFCPSCQDDVVVVAPGDLYNSLSEPCVVM